MSAMRLLPVLGGWRSPEDAQDDAVLPEDLGQAVRQQVRMALRPPFETLLVCSINGALMSSAWFFLPPPFDSLLFSLHGSLAFAYVLAGWMYADVPATNVLGTNAPRILAALDDPVMLRRILFAKTVLLWMVVTPICMVVAVLVGIQNQDLLSILYNVVAIAVVPVGAMGVAAWFGIIWPYHPLPIAVRLDQRKHEPKRFWRWVFVVIAPYGFVPVIISGLLAPSLLLWGVTAPSVLHGKIPDRDLGLGVAIACGISIAASIYGRRFSTHLIAKRRDSLTAFLSDPLQG